MKSSFGVLCAVALLCFGSVRCGSNFEDDDENFLDNTKSGDGGRTGKEADIETSLYKARILWNELTNEISQLSRMHYADTNFKVKDSLTNEKLKEAEKDDEDKCNDDNDCKNEAKCKEGDGGFKKCNCNEGTSGDTCEVIEDCEKGKYEECKDEKGNCVFKDGNAVCECTEGKELNEAKGYCEVEYCKEKCGDVKCEGNKFIEKEVRCVCPDPDQDFDKDEKKCKKKCSDDDNCQNEGKCEGEGDIKFCKCKPGTSGDTCEVIEECSTKYKECKGDKGECIFKDGKADCKCPGGKALNETKGYCEVEYCKEKCGDVKCEGNQFIEKEVRCVCPDPDQDFDKEEKKCKIDYCKQKCGDIKCEGNRFVESEVTCKCSDEDQDFDEEEKKCRKACSDDDCQNEGTCEGTGDIKFCKCKKGTSGDTCEVIEDCNGKFKNCKEDKGECVFKDGKADCKCPDKKALDKTKGYCEDDECVKICGTPYGVQNEELKCVGGPFKNVKCQCQNKEKIFDPEDKECKTNYCTEKCGKVKCEGNPLVEEEVRCVCTDPNQDFNEEEKKCKTNYCRKVCGSGPLVTCDGDLYEPKKKTDCTCTESEYAYNTNKCQKTCSGDDDCQNEGKCEGKGDNKFCKCKTGTSGDTCEVIAECNTKYKDCKEDKGECVFKDGKADCQCPDGKVLNKAKGYCAEICSSDDDCQNEGTCEGKADNKLCKCKRGTSGDTCEVIEECSTKFKDCKGEKGDCVFKDGKADCKCPEGKALRKDKGYCEAKCEKDADCEGSNRQCSKDKLCVCQEGYEGDECDVITGCEDLKKKCEEISTECVFDKPGKPICNCKEGYTYDSKDNKCKHPYCHPENPCKQGECTEEAGAGYCKCPENKYYNYKTEKCEDLADPCILRKTPCGENENCVKGKCVCKDTLIEGEECKPKLCKPNPCFDKAKCSEEDGSCYCEEGKYYNGKRCEDAKCRLNEFKTNCTCPTGWQRRDSNECQPKEGETCSKDCGYGLCFKKDNKETCKCFSFAVTKAGKCTLNSKYCVQSLGLEKDSMKCSCTGKYTHSSDGITCRLKTCKDDGVQEECAAKGGQCKMDWKNVGYYCECPKGYEEDKDMNGKCTDPCSIEKNINVCKKQFCYNYFSPDNPKTFTCGCPPTIQAVNGECSKTAEFAYLIKNIPVLKKKYEMKSGINKVLLNTDLIKSMEQTFGVSLFDYGYLYDYKVSEDVLDCSVWINFKAAPDQTELDKIKLLPQKISNDCDDCIENAVIWPPNVLLSAKGLEEAESNKLQFCSKEVKDLLCGEGTKCKDNKCTCEEGFKIIEYSITEIAEYKVQRCEDINECNLGIHSCPENTTCRNTVGTYRCECNEGFKKQKAPENPETDKSNCYDMCTPSPCAKGKCSLKDKKFDCECEPGVGGSYCDRKDENYASAKKGTVVVGAVLGTLLALGALIVIYYIIKVRKNSGSEDFMPAARMDRAEMTERRPMRGVVNKGYE